MSSLNNLGFLNENSTSLNNLGFLNEDLLTSLNNSILDGIFNNGTNIITGFIPSSNPLDHSGTNIARSKGIIDYADQLNGDNGDNIVNSIKNIDTNPILIHPTCFLGNTPIKTDQGLILIKEINTDIHTIRNQKIIAITKTKSPSKYLICFEKDSLGINYPSNDTVVSKDHKIYYKGNFIEAYKFIEKFKYVTKIPYNQEILYNILMEKYTTVLANNLVCETLHPKNVIAKLYTNKLNDIEKKKAICVLNYCLKNKLYTSYNNFSKHLQKY